MSISNSLRTRYSTKKFDPTKVISEEHLNVIKDLLRLSPSSVNAQPWHFFIVGTKSGKELIAKATQGPYIVNTEKVLNASHVVVLCQKTSIDHNFLEHVLETEVNDGRYRDEKGKAYMSQAREFYTNFHKTELKDLDHWTAKQVYLTAGMLLMGVAALGIDAVPMEGFDAKVLDSELKLGEKGMGSVLVIPLGYRSADDPNAQLTKSRLPAEEVITEL